MTESPGQSSSDDADQEFVKHVARQFDQVKACVYMNFGHLAIDAEDITVQAFAQTRRAWPVDQPVLDTRLRALRIAQKAAEGRRPSEAMAGFSICDMLGPVVSEATRAVLAAVDRLPNTRRVAFLSVSVFGMPNSAVAELLETVESTVRVHLHHARRTFGQRGIDYEPALNELDLLFGSGEAEEDS